MVRELCRTPSGICAVAGSTVRGEIQSSVIGVGSLIEVRKMASIAICGCSDIPGRVAVDTVGRSVSTSEWEGSIVMVKGIVCIASRVAGKTGGAVIGVSGYTHVVIVRFRIHMTGGTGKLHVVGRVNMTVHTFIPFALVLATVDWEVLHVMIKRGWLPGGLSVASDAISRELQGLVIRIRGLIIIRLVAAGTGIRSVVIIPIVARRTIIGDHGMCPIQWIVVIVNGKGGGFPSRFSGMTGSAFYRKSEDRVVRIGGLFEVHHVTG